MPLSEDEQKILEDIESQFYETDPRLAKEVQSTTVYTKHIKLLRWSILVFMAGLLMMIFTLAVHFVLAATGFLLMLVAALMFEHSLRQLGKTTLEQQAQRKHSGDLWDVFGNTGRKMRDRFSKDS